MQNQGRSQPHCWLLAHSLGMLVVAATSSVLSAQTNGSWNVDASGFWTIPTNWNSNPAYPGNGGTAAFGSPATEARTVTLDLDITLGGLTFAGEYPYTINRLEPFQITLNGSHAINVFNGQHEVAVPIMGSVGLVKTGAGTITLSGASTFTGSIFINNGTLRATHAGALGTPTSGTNLLLGAGSVLQLDPGAMSSIDLGERKIALASGVPAEMGGSLRVLSGSNFSAGDIFIMSKAVLNVSDFASLTQSGEIIDNNISGSNGLTKMGGGLLEVRRFGGGPFAPQNAPQPLTSLSILDGTARVTPTGDFESSTSRINSLSITDGQLDLTNNRMVIDYTESSPLETIRSFMLDGKILSGQFGRRVGYAEATSLFTELPLTWSGQPIDSTSLLLKSTLPGDLNLDGAVNFQDLLRIAQRYGGTGFWIDGDVTYDGLVNFNDLLTLSQNYGMSLMDTELTSINSESFAADWTRARATVPEPTMIGLLALMMIIGSRHRFSL